MVNYLLLILTGIIAFLGVLYKSDKEIKLNGKKKRIITGWGIVILIGLTSTLSLSILKQYFDDKKSERIDEENNYLKFSELPVGPNVIFNIIFNNSPLTDNP